MSDPVSNVEIEDVLSSIRQLISAGQTDKADGTNPQQEADNKLILTPAFRVFDGDMADADTKRTRDGRDIPVEKLQHEDLDTELHEVDQEKALETLVETFKGGDDVQELPDASAVSNDPPVDYEDNWDDESVGETAQVAFLHERLARAEPEDQSEAIAPEPQDEPELTASEDVVEAEIADAVDAEPIEAELVTDHDSFDDSAEVADLDDAGHENDLDAVVEAVVADTDNAFDEAEGGNSTEALNDPETLDGETVVEDTVSILMPETAPRAEIVDDETDFIDEDHLQDIVSRIVRDELQGQMGVKITQAVRRMVRREVTRALSIEKFD